MDLSLDGLGADGSGQVLRVNALKVLTREDLIALLHEAAELEHGLCCSYLYAAFSLKVGDDTLTSTQDEAVCRWRGVVGGVAAEEMLHLGLVANLLTAVGGAPHFGRPGFPQRSRFYPGGLSIGLRRFDDETLSLFMHLERPVDMDVETGIGTDPDVDLDAAPPATPPGSLTRTDQVLTPDPGDLATVGQLYEAIEAGFIELDRHIGQDRLFIGPPDAQVGEEAFRLSGLTPVADLDSARIALATLVEQGEGVRGDWTDAHYGKFRRVRDELRSLRQADPALDPAWPCVDNPVGPDTIPSDNQTAVTGHDAVDLLNLFNNSYTLMTNMLLRMFAHADDGMVALQALADSARRLMTAVLGPIGNLLATVPADNGSNATAGASFEMHRAATLVPHRPAAWLILSEQTDRISQFAEQLSAEIDAPNLASARDTLADIACTVRRQA